VIFSFGRTQGVADIRTARLRLVAITPAMLNAEQAEDATLSKLLRATVTDEWPPRDWEPHVLRFILKQYEEEPDTVGWHRYVLLPNGYGRKVLIGCIGGFPKADGEVEIGYSTLPAFQRKGFATEAVAAFVDWLLTHENVSQVTAQTFPHMPESIKVMERSGMAYIGCGDEDGTVRYCRMR
jgi:[ribosomal protein S5]-alanine N-acetyltransferase